MGEEARGGVEICGCQFECVWDWGGVCGGVSEGDDDDFSDCESTLVSRPEAAGKVMGGFANEPCGQPIPMYNWIAFVGFAAYSIYAQTNGLQGNVGEFSELRDWRFYADDGCSGHLGHLGGMAFGALYWLVRIRRPF